MFNPTDIDRATVAAAYDNIYRGPADPVFSAADYEVCGLVATLTDGGYSPYWIYTLAEAAETGVCRTEGEVIQIGRRKWIVVLGNP